MLDQFDQNEMSELLQQYKNLPLVTLYQLSASSPIEIFSTYDKQLMATMDSESLSNNSFTLSSVSKHYLIDSSKDVSILYYFFLRLFYLSDSSYLSICKAFGLQAFIHSLYYIHLYSYSANYGDEAYFDRQNMEYQQLLIEYYELLLMILSSIIKTYHIKSSTLV